MVRRIVLAVAALVLAACGGEDAAPSGRPPATSPTPSGTVDLAPSAVIGSEVVDPFVFASDDAVYLGGTSSVARIDPRTEAVRWHAEFAGYAVAGGFGAVWVADLDRSTIRQLDPLTGELLREIYVDGSPIAVLVTPTGVWTANHRGGSVSRIDPRSRQVELTTSVGPAGLAGPHSLGYDGSSLYVGVGNANTVVQLNEETGRAVSRVKLPAAITPCGPLTIDGPYVWVSGCAEADRVARIDFSTGEYVVSEPLGAFVRDGLVRGGQVWFSGHEPDGGGVFVVLDRQTLAEVGTMAVEKTNGSSAAAFGSWWVAGEAGVARFELEELVLD